MTEVELGILVAFSAGIFSFLSPCVLPLVPSYLTFVTGMSMDDLESGTDRHLTMIHASLFVLGFSVVFILLGAGASFLGQFFRAYELWVARIGGAVIILFGLFLVGAFQLTPLLSEKRVQLADKPAGFLGTIGVGMAFGAGWTPCIGPALGAILTLGFSQDTMWAGVGLLSMYSLGLAVPFLLAAFALDRFLTVFARFRSWIPIVEKASGVLLIALGILLITGQFTILAGWLQQYTPAFLLERM